MDKLGININMKLTLVSKNVIIDLGFQLTKLSKAQILISQNRFGLFSQVNTKTNQINSNKIMLPHEYMGKNLD